MNIHHPQLINQTRNVLHFLFKLFIVKTAVAALLLTIFDISTGAMRQEAVDLVSSASKVAWLGAAPEGYIRIYTCTDGSPIDRNHVTNRPLCPASSVEAIPIEEAAEATYERLLISSFTFYLKSLILAALVQLVVSAWREIKSHKSGRNKVTL